MADDSVAITLADAIEAAQPEIKETLMTLAEKWKAEGEARGVVRGKADTLRKLLTLKFGELPKTTALRLASAPEADLDLWVERVLGADALDRVMAP